MTDFTGVRSKQRHQQEFGPFLFSITWGHYTYHLTKKGTGQRGAEDPSITWTNALSNTVTKRLTSVYRDHRVWQWHKGLWALTRSEQSTEQQETEHAPRPVYMLRTNHLARRQSLRLASTKICCPPGWHLRL